MVLFGWPVVVVELDGGKRNLPPGRAAHGDTQRVGAHDFEAQFLVAVHPVERSAVGVGDLLGRNQDRLEQPIDVLLARQRDADLVQLGQPRKQIGDGRVVHR